MEEQAGVAEIKRKRIRKIIGCMLMITGIIIISGSEWDTFEKELDRKAQIQKVENNELESLKTSEWWNEILQYNMEIFVNHQKDFKDEETVKHRPEQLQEMESDLFGIIDIPAMDCRLPLYLGASSENMERGAAVLGGTSIPVGGCNTNSVIAGHRGWKRSRFFKDIQKLNEGDVVYVINPWETLCYRVERIEVIEPEDSDKVKIQAGRDMISLITCHPYRSGGRYRYVVYCVRNFEQHMEQENAVGMMNSEKGNRGE